MFNLKELLLTQVIHSAYKFRIYPTEEQKMFLHKQFGCCRLVYNFSLNYSEKIYSQEKRTASIYKEIKPLLSIMKQTKEYVFLKEVNSQSLQSSVLCFGKARDNFLKCKGGKPKFKKKNGRQSFEVPQNFLLQMSKRGNCFLVIPKLKTSLKIKVHRPIRGDQRHLHVSMDPDGRYYASINCVHEEYCVSLVKDYNTIGLDLGLPHLFTSDNGLKQEALKPLKKSEKKLKKACRKLSNKSRGGKNRQKARLQVAKKHSKVARQRKDFIHKQSNKIVNENQVIYLETLHIKGMMQNHCLSKSVSDSMLGEFVRQCKYKSKWRGREFVQIGRFEPSSKRCSTCGTQNDTLKLQHRKWTCNVCGALHDRDINAAKNIKKIGQGMSKFTPVERLTSVCSLMRWQTSWLKETGSGF